MKDSIPGLRYLVAASKDDSCTEALLKAGIEKLFLPGEVGVYEFARDHISANGVFPKIETIEEETGVEMPEAPEPPKYYLEQLRKRHLNRGRRNAVDKAAENLNGGKADPRAAVSTMMEDLSVLRALDDSFAGEAEGDDGFIDFEGPEPETAADLEWLVEGRLPRGGSSLFHGVPKCGKSTTARSLALSVCRGTPWLGYPVTQGRVIYVMLEGPGRKHLVSEFKQLGMTFGPDARLSVWGGSATPGLLDGLAVQIQRKEPALVVIDPIVRLLPVEDLRDYGKVYKALGAVIEISKKVESHLMLIHHSRKSGGNDIESALDSTALTGIVDTVLRVKIGKNSQRTLTTVQRVGESLSTGQVLKMSPQTHAIGVEAEDAGGLTTTESRILEYLSTCSELVPRKKIVAEVQGGAQVISQALESLYERGDVVRHTGTHGSHHFAIAKVDESKGTAA